MAHTKNQQPASPFMPMFEAFRTELDEHHDRRERIVKASRDITAASKKMVRTLGTALPHFVEKSNAQYWKTIETQFQSISSDVQGLNAYRYPQLTWGNQEFMEALSFQHYLETQTLISYDDSKARVAALCGDQPTVPLTPEDYVLGIYDMIGELMRFSITAMATTGKLPAASPKRSQADEASTDKMDVDEQSTGPPRNVLDDLRDIRLRLEMFEPSQGSKFAHDAEKKGEVMRECVNKVENALYSLTVRGKERPKGWSPDVREDRRTEVQSY
ncbi:translin associated factor X [Sporormia fimetaria CBS 119925]|uniref:Translin associated factor X n=1 Tax=Sporormia fimetaria CBS 119925 TaxID=1340428 RepID=A0A6A6VQC6_9PLEO|nr:translin associated factor X [Sporormia fimetaria CBS 119925]